MRSENRQRFYYPELDGLRFIAFLLVFVHNAPFVESSKTWTALHEYGWVGVDLFFCLSGFLITKLLIAEHQQHGTINIRHFYIRRILRIWPLYFLYLAIGLLFIYQTQGWVEVIPKHLAGLLSFTYDFVYLFLTYKTFAVYWHLWTISYEEQFYALIPWLLRKIDITAKKVIWRHLVGIFLAGSLIRAGLICFQFKHPVIYMLPFTHFEAMLGGIAISLGLFDEVFEKIQRWVILLLGLAANTIVFFLPNTYEIGWNLMLAYPLVGIGMTLIVLGILKKEKLVIVKWLNNKLLVYLGKISYGLYIFHILSLSLAALIVQNVFGWTAPPTDLDQALIFLGGLILTVMFSIASYHFLEKPFLKLKDRFGIISSRPI